MFRSSPFPCALLLCGALASSAPATGAPSLAHEIIDWHPAEDGLRLSMDLPLPELVQEDAEWVYRIEEGASIGRPGAPDLPLISRLLAMPATGGAELVVVEEQWESMPSAWITPEQERLHTPADLPLPWIEDEELYARDAFWPEATARIGEPMLLRDTRLLKLDLHPLRWNPVSRELQALRRVELVVEYNTEPSINELQREMPASSLFSGFLRDQVLLPPSAEGALSEIGWESPSLPLRYLVIGSAVAQSNPAFQNWLAWKNRKGHPVDQLTEADLSFTTTGIRAAIVEAYNSDTPPDYVFLLGDADGGSYNLPTHGNQYDHYYANITGDVLADLVVGRIPARNSTSMTTIFNKILAYELDPEMLNTDWLQRASFLTGAGHCGLSMSQLSRSVAIDMVNDHGYTQIDTAFCANSPSYVYGWYNAGISFHTYRGYYGMEGLNTNQVLSLAQGNRTPISVIFTCGSGTFNSQDPCFTEAFLRAGNPATPGGGAAAMGFCTLNTHTAYNNLVCGGFYSALLHYDIREVGTAMFRGKYELYRTLPSGDPNVNSFSYWANLMGDPGMPVWLGVPDYLAIIETPDVLASNATSLSLQVIDALGPPVEGAAVCLSQPGGFQLLGTSDAEGWITFALPELDEFQPLQITASKADFLPALEDLSIGGDLLPEVTALQVLDHTGPLVPGGDYELNVRVQAMGMPLSNLSLELELEDGAGVVTTATQPLPDLGPAEAAFINSPFVFSLFPTLVDHDLLDLRLTLRSDETVLAEFSEELDLASPHLVLLDHNPWQQTLEPGNTELIAFEVLNAGTADAVDLEILSGFPEGSPLSVASGTESLTLAAGETTTDLQFYVTASGDAVPGYTESLLVRWTSPEGPWSEMHLPVRVGLGQPTEPTGPDAYGYYAYEDDDDWPLALEYGWNEIAPNAGGSGIELVLDDHGDEQDDARMVDLPFPFTYYGRSYDEMSVCSNGFVAFGTNAHLECDFRNHYMPVGMGPEAMIGVMWDDHKLIGDAQVATASFPESGLFVVEWYRMRTNSNNQINTFQLILLDPAVYPTPTGDGEFVMQYQLFNNSQTNAQDFPYCTIGIEDHTGRVGLTLTNYNSWDPTAQPITDVRAIRFTTRDASIAGDAVLSVDPAPLWFTLSPDEEDTAEGSITFSNTGDGLLSWSARAESLGDWLPEGLTPLRPSGSREDGGPDIFGYTWLDSEEPGGPEVAFRDITQEGGAVAFVQNDAPVGPFDLPFAFPFYGETHDSYYIAPNGYISFTDDANHWNNSGGAMPSGQAPENAICGWWDDLLGDDNLEGHVFRHASGDSLVVSWVEAPHYNQGQYGGPFTFQIILEANGRITLQYGDMAATDDDSDSGTVGLQGPENDLGFVVQHMERSVNDYAVHILPPIWLQLPQRSGILAGGSGIDLPMQVYNSINGLLPEGDYEGEVVLSANTGQEPVRVAVHLHVGAVSVDENTRPASFALEAPVPNPFNPVTRIAFSLAESRTVRLEVYNLQGQKVASLLQGERLPAGEHTQGFDASALSSGIYLLRLHAGDFSAARKMTLLK